MVIYAPDLQMELRERDGTLVAALDVGTGITWDTADNDVGTGSVSVPGDEAVGLELTAGRDLWCYYRGLPAEHLVMVRGPARVLHSEDEEAGQKWAVTAPTVIEEWKYASVLPFRGTTDGPIMPQHRLWTFASPDYPFGLGEHGWGFAVQGLRADELDPFRNVLNEYITVHSDQEDDVEFLPYPAPRDWEVPQARWIWSQADTTVPGICFFRKTMTITETKTVTFDVTGDNYYTLYLDGNPLIGEDVDPWCWQKFKRHTVEDLPAGTYTLAAVVENVPGQGTNPAGFLFGAYVADNDGAPVEFLEWSNNTWLALGYPPDGQWPGWTAGYIIEDALDEFQAEGFLAAWTLAFTGTHDTNGVPWPFIPEFGLPVGSTGFDILRDLVRQGWIDFRPQPFTRTLQAFVQSDGFESGIELEVTADTETQNLQTDDFEPVDQVALSSLVAKWASGYVKATDPAAATAFGAKRGFMTVDANTEVEAQRKVDLALERNNAPHWSNVVSIRPTSDADAPYFSFITGWQVIAPDIYSTPQYRRVVSITMAQNDEGVAAPIIDLERPVEAEDPTVDLLETIGRGITGSGVIRNTGMSTSALATGRSGNASTFSPSTRPIYNPAPIEGTRKHVLPAALVGGGGGGLSELHPFSFGGVIRVPFSGTALETNMYLVRDAVEVTELAVTLLYLDSGAGPAFEMVVNGSVAYTSPRIVDPSDVFAVSIAIPAGALVSLRVPAGFTGAPGGGSWAGDGFASGLTVVARLAA